MARRPAGGARHPVPICAIGASAGGLAALRALFGGLPGDLGLAYVVIVHLAPDHPSQLDEILSQSTSMPVRQVTDTPLLEPDCIYVIPPDRELVIEGDDVHAREFTEPRGRRAPIDLFFRSVAAGRGDGMAVILSGAGSDGAVGVKRIKEGGGVVFVQDPAEAEYPMMPRSAIATGVADFVVPIREMTERIAEVSRSKAAMASIAQDEAGAALKRITGHLHARTGHDFSSYKRATVMRRVMRRMQVTRRASLGAYETYLRETPEEAQELFSDLLITVTMFFRDPSAFEALREGAIGPIVEAADPAAGVRAWVAGCATGEEAYSLAMVMIEEAERRGRAVPIQIFATDLDEGALATAREGRYARAIEADVPEHRLARFFVEEGAHWRIRQEVRDTVLFAHHSAVKDPPFMRLDLISCRNLLIYLEREVQRQMLALFHYALKPGGTLFLGSAETVDTRPDLFAPVDRDARVYAARAQVGGGAALVMQMPVEHRPHLPAPRPAARPADPAGATGKLHAASLESAAPASALVDSERRVLHLSESAGRYIAPSRGPLSNELPALVRPELRAELSGALHRALGRGEPTLTLPAAVAFDGGPRRVVMQVTPVPVGPQEAPRALAFFLDGGPALPDEEGEETAPAEVRRLREELRAAHERLAVSRREHEDATQELRVANEELQSINEEYRSTSEELETSKEELQSINEELQTVNAELKAKLDSIASAHSDLENLVAATEIGTLFLDPRLRIKMFTPVVAQVFNITEADVGRAITDFTHHLSYDGIEEDARRVLRELTPFESEVKTRDGRWMMMRIRPYRTLDDRIDGAVVSFVDVTARVRAEGRLRESEERYATLFETMDEGFLIAEMVRDDAGEAVDVRYLEANPAAGRLTGIDLAGRRLGELGPAFEAHWWRVPARVAKTRVSERHELFAAPLGQWFEILVNPIDGDQVAILFQDATERRREQEALRRTRDLVAMATDASKLGWWSWDFDTGAMDWDARGREIAGLPKDGAVVGDEPLRRIHPEDRERVEAQVARSIERGEPLDVEYRVVRADGTTRHVHHTGAFRREGEGEGPILGTGLVRDITELKRAEAERELLIGELNHRVKNMLTVIQSVARQTQRGAGSVEAYAEAFQRRLHALAAAYGLLTQSRWAGSSLGDLAQAALASFVPEGDARLRLDGPRVQLSPSATLSLAMALHELGTNAMKHGALSSPEGRVEVEWRVEPSAGGADGGRGSFHLEWRERDGPPVASPTHQGFGTRLLERGVASELDGTVALDYREDGLRCVMDLPLGDGIGP